MERRYNHYGRAGARGWEEVLGKTSGDGSDPAPPAELVHVGSAGGSCPSEEKLAIAPKMSVHGLVHLFSRFGSFQRPAAGGKPSDAVTWHKFSQMVFQTVMPCAWF